MRPGVGGDTSPAAASISSTKVIGSDAAVCDAELPT